jgi:SAM-dependent methyltransferase
MRQGRLIQMSQALDKSHNELILRRRKKQKIKKLFMLFIMLVSLFITLCLKLPYFNIKNADMLNLPYDDNSFDCVFSYHVISHTDTAGAKRIISEIHRVLKPGGEVYLTLCSKETRSFKDAGYPKIDENSIVKTGEGPEKGIPHFYINLDEIIKLFINFNLLRIRHTDDCFFEGKKQNSIHYYIHAISTKH